MDPSIQDLRREYRQSGLHENDLAADPFAQFENWWSAALKACAIEPNAMSLATSTPDGRPSVRMVLLKACDPRGLVFYTNFDSRKGAELAANPRAAMCFWWGELERQVRVEGRIERADATEADAYFKTRPWYSQIGALASSQSKPIPNREALEARALELAAQFAGKPVPRPSNWGGYRLIPDLFEFWQGRESRLHDRLCYLRQPDGSWKIQRLSP